MARSSTSDPLTKFRFNITVISIDLSINSLVDTIAAISGPNTFAKNNLAVLARAGFSEITLPKATVNEVPYRENLDSQRFTKSPGLVKFEPIVLRRGSTVNMDLYEWYRLVNDDTLLQTTATQLGLGSSIVPQSDNFRKEVIITALDRAGQEVKQWLLFNAWPSSYKGGNDFSASSEDNLIEELTLTYESFQELEGGVSGLAKEAAKDALNGAIGAGVAGVASNALGKIPSPF
jgi:phage tail-like protein